MDYKVHDNFYHDLQHDKFNAVESPFKFNEDVQNSLMAVKPNHPFSKKLIDNLYKYRNKGNELQVAGPKFLSDIMNQYKNKVNYIKNILFLPKFMIY